MNSVCVCVWGGGATFLNTIEGSGGMPPPPPPPPPQKFFLFFLVFSCSETEAKFLIEQLNTCFIDHTDLVLWLTYCMKKKES